MRFSPLDAAHRRAGARMVPFGGWEMPVQYTGVLDEHRKCRSAGVVFDVSHLGTIRVTGADAHHVLQWAFTNDLDRIGPGRAQYTHLLDHGDAHVVDDIIVWWLGDDEYAVMPNASNTERIVAALGEATGAAGGGFAAADITGDRAVLAVQGPNALAMLAEIDDELADLASTARFAVRRGQWRGSDCVVAGTGYTGEAGVEIQVPAPRAEALWDAVVAGGLVPAGLGARDTLRLEAGLPLHGHELGPGITPLQAGLGWVVRFDKGDFRGRAPLLAERDRGLTRRLRGFVTAGRQPPREGGTIVIGDAEVGVVTSGNFSPGLGRGIALGFVPPDVADGTAVEIEQRGRRIAARVAATPFVDRTARG